MTGPQGDLRLVGRLIDASNGTFLAADDDGARWVYKPVAGESPLWDFPNETLGRREVAAFRLAEALRLDVVPLTVWVDGPLGEGSAQQWVDGEATNLIDLLRPEDVTSAWMPVVSGVDQDDRPVVLAHRDDPRLRQIALFDVLLNNSDRKASHIIADGDRLVGVDHGVSLHVEDKLRTVLWGWAGDPLTEEELRLVSRAAELSLDGIIGLSGAEADAWIQRAEALLTTGTFPSPSGNWPAIPWPPL